MKKTWITNKKSRLSLSFGTVLAASILMICVGLSAVAFAASDGMGVKKELPYEFIRIFDPFELKSIPVRVNQIEDEDTEETNPVSDIILFNLRKGGNPIRIPYRPKVRSPFRPPLVGR